MRFLRLLFLVIVAVILVTIAMANRAVVNLTLLPDEIAAILPMPVANSVSLPLFLVIFAAIALGLLIGFVWEYLREHHHRVEARNERSARQRLEREVRGLKRRQSPGGDGADDILAIVDGSASR